MKYTVIDIETSGLSIDECVVFQVSAVTDDLNKQLPLEDLQTFNVYIDNGVGFYCEPSAIKINEKIFDIISKIKINGNYANYNNSDDVYMIRGNEKLIKPYQFMNFFKDYLFHAYLITDQNEFKKTWFNFGGKNISMFDLPICERVFPEFKSLLNISHRIIDPSILFLDYKKDKKLPNLQTCLDRAGIEKTVTHNALDDCFDVIKLIRHHFNK